MHHARTFGVASALVALGALAGHARAEPSGSAAPSRQACVAAANDGQRTRDDGRWLDARASFLTCAAGSCPVVVRTECARWLTDLDEKLPSLVVGARTAAGDDLSRVHVTLDGRPFASVLDGRPRAVDPGAHHLVFTTGDGRSSALDIVVRAGESARSVVVTFPAVADPGAPAAPAAPPSVAASPSVAPLFLFGGVAVASAALAAGMVAYAHGEDEVLSSSCSPRCHDDALRPLRTSLVVANVAAVASLVSLGALGYVVWRRAARPGHGAASLTAVPHALGAAALLRF